MAQKAYINGKIVDEDRAVISVFDRGFLYGDGLFETMRSYDGRIFRLREHLTRLYSSMKFLKICQPFSEKEAGKVIYGLLRASGIKDGRIRVTVSRGASEGRKIDISKSGPSNIAVFAEEYAPPPDKRYESGIAVDIARSRRNSRSILKNFKMLNYADSLLARNEAYSKGFFDAVFLNDAGFVCGGSASNIFMFSAGRLLTPSLDCAALPGITRQAVLEISRYVGVGVEEGKFSLEELKNAEEAFITNSMFEVMPVVRAEDRVIGGGSPGAFTKKIRLLYKELVEKDCAKEKI